ncbi:MAG: hypothetical protein U0002_20215 [Thermoanaerobaculia bacterium]
MRLKKVERKLPWSKRLLIAVLTVVNRSRVPDVARTMMYRADFFGKPYSTLLNKGLRGPSGWTVGEREMIAAFTSRQNACVY